MISANGGLPAHRYTPQVTPRWPRGSEPASVADAQNDLCITHVLLVCPINYRAPRWGVHQPIGNDTQLPMHNIVLHGQARQAGNAIHVPKALQF